MTTLSLLHSFITRLKAIVAKVAPTKTLVVWQARCCSCLWRCLRDSMSYMCTQELFDGLGDAALPAGAVVEVWRDWDGDPAKSILNVISTERPVIVAANACVPSIQTLQLHHLCDMI